MDQKNQPSGVTEKQKPQALSLRERVVADMKSAMKHKKTSELQSLKLLYAECRNREIELKSELDDVQMAGLFKKQIKQYEESIAQYEKAGRLSSAQEQKARCELLQSYLPKALSEKELNSLVEETVKELNAVSLKEMGKVIKALQSRTAGSADNRRLAALVKKRLQVV